MKKTLCLLCLLVYLGGSAWAQATRQPHSIIIQTGLGYGAFPGLIADVTTGHRIVALGTDWKYAFAEHWALLTGLDFHYYHFKGYSYHDGIPHPFTKSVPVLRLPVRLEYQKRWFYLAFGPYVERDLGNYFSGSITELATIGPTTEIGGRIRLTETSRLRIGLQTSVGVAIGINNNYHQLVLQQVEASCLLRIGYEFAISHSKEHRCRSHTL